MPVAMWFLIVTLKNLPCSPYKPSSPPPALALSHGFFLKATKNHQVMSRLRY